MPAIIPVAAAVIGGAAAAVGGASGVGKNGMRASNFADSDKYNPNAFNYGGAPGGAQQATQRYEGLAGAAMNRSQPFSVQGNTDYTGANNWEAAQLGGRNGQDQAAMMMHRRAAGQTPSIAGAQAAHDIGMLQQGTANQMRMAQAQQAAQQGSARGAAGVALAGQGAANNMANTGQALGQAQTQGIQNISGQAQINAMQERAQAEQAAFGAWSGMRQGDQAAQAQAAGQAQFDANLSQQNNQFNANMMLQNRAQNDQTGLAYNQLANSVNAQQLQAGMNQQGLLAQTHGSTDALNMNRNAQNAQREMQFMQMGVGAVEGAAQMGMAKGKAEGGPIVAGRPYVVGERGPELIVPRTHGLVVPNDELPFSMSDAIAAKQREGRRDPVSFHRDDAADQAAARERYYRSLMKEADAYKAGMQASMGRGASVVRDEGEIDAGAPASWLVAEMDRRGEGDGLLSDDRAKLQAAKEEGYYMGLHNGQVLESSRGEQDKANRGPLGRPPELPVRDLNAERYSKQPFDRSYNLGSKAPAKNEFSTTFEAPSHPDVADGRERASNAAYEREMAGQPGRTRGDATKQLAEGLAPFALEYKPGMGPSGARPMVRAQLMEKQPITAPAVRRRPDGLREIDRDQGLSTALAGVGLLAQRLDALQGRTGR
ncbi:MAG TPA: hypothetical protein VFV90_12060 [Usitatibacter sp.]|nr:hypothetical protein [Usitatibacter sp.]